MAIGNGTNEQLGMTTAESLAQMQVGTMTETMRSFKDSISFQFQNLNLALTQLNSNISNLSTRLATMLPTTGMQGLPANFIAASNPNSVYLGDTPAAYANLSANSSYTSMMYPSSVPSNVGSYNMGYYAAKELPFKRTNMMLTGLGAVANTGVSLLGGAAGGALLGTALMPGLGTVIGGIAGGLVGDRLTAPLIEDAIVHNRDVFGIQRASKRFGREFTLGQAQSVTRQLEGMAYNEVMTKTSMDPMLGMSGLRELAMTGAQMGMFRAGGSQQDFINQMKNAAQVVTAIAKVAGDGDVREALKTVQQLKSMGFNAFESTQAAKSLLNDTMKFSSLMGVNQKDFMNAAMNVAMGGFGSQGYAAAFGMQPAIRNLALVNELNKRRMLTPGELAMAGGEQAVAQQVTGAQAALLRSPLGRAAIYAGMDSRGNFNINNVYRNGRGAFDIIGAGLNNYFRDPVAYAANEDRAIENAANQGDLVGLLDTLVGAEARLNPFMKINGSLEQQENAMIALLKERYGLSGASARAWVYKKTRPSIMRGLQARADREGIMRQVGEANMKMGVGGLWAGIKAIPGRIGASMYEALNIRGFTDQLTAANQDAIRSTIGQVGSFNDFNTALKVAETLKQGTNDPYARFDPETFQDSVDRVTGNAGVIDSFLNAINPGQLRGSAGAILYNMNVANKNLFKLKDSAKFDEFSTLATAQREGLLGATSANEITKRIYNKVGYSGTANIGHVRSAMGDMVAENMGTAELNYRVQGRLSTLEGADGATDVFNNLDTLLASKIDPRRGFKGKTVQERIANSKLSSTGMQELLNMADADGAVSALAKRLNVSKSDLITGYIANRKGVDSLTNDQKASLVGGDAYNNLLALGMRLTNLETPLGLENTKPLKLWDGRKLAGLEGLGLTQQFFEEVMNSNEGGTLKEDLVAFSKFARDMVANKGGKVNFADYEKSFTGSKIKKLALELSKKDRGVVGTNIRMALGDNVSFIMGGTGLANTPLTDEEFATFTNNLKGMSGSLIQDASLNQASVGMRALGLNFSEDDIRTLFTESETEKDKASKLVLQRRALSKLYNGDIEQRNIYNNVERLAKAKNFGSGVDGEIARNNYMLTVAQATKYDDIKTTNDKNSDKVTSKIDTTVTDAKGGKAVRVIIDQEKPNLADTDKGRDQIAKNTDSKYQSQLSHLNESDKELFIQAMRAIDQQRNNYNTIP